ncbi:hypothetical protein Nepgr_021022 [Nepenthes gracilis]|uniref:Uncharacterized protein n=1 Tax=Nepenthes gracilis TaxID=150966 RepID=A0AAD3SYD3_NEPGR|nr:hypothetical protein Nepgr_021022 [Nepenthes gracilis]
MKGHWANAQSAAPVVASASATALPCIYYSPNQQDENGANSSRPYSPSERAPATQQTRCPDQQINSLEHQYSGCIQSSIYSFDTHNAGVCNQLHQATEKHRQQFQQLNLHNRFYHLPATAAPIQ